MDSVDCDGGAFHRMSSLRLPSMPPCRPSPCRQARPWQSAMTSSRRLGRVSRWIQHGHLDHRGRPHRPLPAYHHGRPGQVATILALASLLMYPDAAFTPGRRTPQAIGCAVTARGEQTGTGYAASSPQVRYPASCTLNYTPRRIPAGDLDRGEG